ncbi:ATP-binding cassette domain-containing protein [Microbacterium marinilacus]|uniref:ABC transporter domain-containing protein n=1 Tax=Microbacterium marinilacus TaxID=415209 RepID=A0ABP7BJH0_9MICO|nr:ATP-binding cassette domain-containing protein [Microbacterium marinilacus]MBY0689688.1 ATP-binding cassette domain-containing protein [Microbacterium marinilacus]
MADGKVLEFRGVTKTFGDVAAVSDLTARVEPGAVTGFVGPNGAGKSTTLRILLGELRPTEGSALIGGVPYARLDKPRREVGSLLENPSYRPRRTAERHLMSVARSIGVPATRVAEVLEVVGLGAVGDMRIGGFSLGMRQRLGVAEALLGDPGVLVFDEPANGLDPEGIRWMRLLMRRLADEGRTVLMSSHVLSEVQQVADDILIISNGRLLFSGGIEHLADVDAVVAVDSPNRAALRDALRERGVEFELLRSGFNVPGSTTAEIGELAAAAGVPLSSLQLRQQSLEDVFLKIVGGAWTAPVPAPAEAEADAPEEAPAEADAPEEAKADAQEGTADVQTEDGAGAEGDAESDESAAPTTGAAGGGATGQPASDGTEEPSPAQTAQDALDDVNGTDGVDAEPRTGMRSAEEVAPSAEETPAEETPAEDRPAADGGRDPLAFLSRPLSEVEREVIAGETALIAASPVGEQPTPGWVPAPEAVPSPAEEDADDPDSLETADSVVDLPGSEADADGEVTAHADAQDDVDAADDVDGQDDVDAQEDVDGQDATVEDAHDEPEGDGRPASDERHEDDHDGRHAGDVDPSRSDDADTPDPLEAPDEVVEVGEADHGDGRDGDADQDDQGAGVAPPRPASSVDPLAFEPVTNFIPQAPPRPRGASFGATTDDEQPASSRGWPGFARFAKRETPAPQTDAPAPQDGFGRLFATFDEAAELERRDGDPRA